MQLVYFLLFSAAVTVAHAFMLLHVKRTHVAEKREKLWKWHLHLIGTLWILNIIWLILLHFYFSPVSFPPWAIIIGVFCIGTGLLLYTRSRLLLGRNQAMGMRFFFPEKSKKITTGVYHFLHNPMYDGFVLIFLGIGLLFGFVEDFYLATASFVLFNIFLASVENFEFHWNPF